MSMTELASRTSTIGISHHRRTAQKKLTSSVAMSSRDRTLAIIGSSSASDQDDEEVSLAAPGSGSNRPGPRRDRCRAPDRAARRGARPNTLRRTDGLGGVPRRHSAGAWASAAVYDTRPRADYCRIPHWLQEGSTGPRQPVSTRGCLLWDQRDRIGWHSWPVGRVLLTGWRIITATGENREAVRVRTVAGRFVALALGVVVTALFAEIGIRFVAPQPLQHIQLDDQLYFVNRPFARFLYAKENEYSVDVAYNAWGFRGPIPDPSPAPGVTRILLIGDSQTEGLQVRYEETYGAVLRRDLERLLPDRRFEVINLAVSAYGTHQEVLTLRRYGARVRPSWIVLGFYPGNDLSDNVR